MYSLNHKLFTFVLHSFKVYSMISLKISKSYIIFNFNAFFYLKPSSPRAGCKTMSAFLKGGLSGLDSAFFIFCLC